MCIYYYVTYVTLYIYIIIIIIKSKSYRGNAGSNIGVTLRQVLFICCLFWRKAFILLGMNVDSLKNLNKQQIALVLALADGKRIRAAADIAGYSESYARELAIQPKIKKAIEETQARVVDKATFDKAAILNHLAAMIGADVGDILRDDGEYKPLNQWPKIWRQMVSSIKHDNKNGGIAEVRFVDRLKLIQLLGNHVDVSAFAEQVNHTHGTVADRMKAAQDRLANAKTVKAERIE